METYRNLRQVRAFGAIGSVFDLKFEKTVVQHVSLTKQSKTAKPRPIIGIWRLGNVIHTSQTAELSLAQPADANGSPRWDYIIRRCAGASSVESLRQIRQFTACAVEVLHPNLVAVLDASDCDNAPFLVMPRLEGQTMQRFLDDEPRKLLPVGLWFVRQVAQALAALHRRGWTHGDVKPANVLVGETGHVTLIDLGFAERIHAVPQGVFRGTPEYASPESLSGKTAITSASDIFSLGQMLWRWLTRVKFVSDQQLSPVAVLVEQMIAEDPAQRPAAGDVAGELLRLEIENLGCHIEPERATRHAA